MQPTAEQLKTTGGKAVEGAWYGGQRYMNGALLPVGQYEPGKMTSNEVIAQTNPANVAYIENLKASSIQPAVNLNLPSGSTSSTNNTAGLQAAADNARKVLDETLASQKIEVEKKLADLRTKEQDILKNKVEPLVQPFREDLEKTQRESLYINENFEANQALVNELESLLTEGNALIKQQQDVTGLASIRNPRVQQTMSDIQARAGVIQAVMTARNNQITQAFTMIDRTADAITKDRNDQLSYYNTILDLNRKDMLSLDEESKSIATKQVKLLEDDNTRAQETVDYVKKLLINPDTAKIMGQAGVTLNDSVEQINQKIKTAQYANEVADLSNKMAEGGYAAVIDPSTVDKSKLVTVTDSQGQKYYYQKIKADSTGTASEKDIRLAAGQAAQAGKTYQDMLAFFIKYGLTAKEIYDIYTATNYYGRPPDNVDPKTGLYKTTKKK
jgi:hypothetical protein